MAARIPDRLLVPLLLLAGTAEADPVINEILPDPDGADTGREFVELHNPAVESVPLAGVRLEFANGTDGVWQTRWTAPAEAVLGPDARYLIVDTGWDGAAAPDAEVRLGLQNGPDAVRLVRGDDLLDLVGYGTPLAAELHETAPAAAATGRSLARRPDGHDTDDNAADFVLTTPTPGAVNFRRWNLTVASLSCEPPSLARPGDEVAIVVGVSQGGWDSWPAGTARCRVGAATVDLSWPGCAPAGGAEIAWRARPAAEGPTAVTIEFPLPDGSGHLRLDAGALQVGPATVVLSEVMAAPGDGQGEWIELAALAAGELGDLRLRDADGDWRPLPPRLLAAGDLVVLAADPAALQVRALAVGAGGACTVAPLQIVAVAGWPTLNNSAPAARDWADRVLLGDRRGLVLDHVTLGAGGAVPDGRSRERVGLRPLHPLGDNWATSTAPAGGTPGCPNSVSAPGGASGGLSATPRCLDPVAGAGSVHLRFSLVEGERSWRVAIHDLWGAAVRSFGDDGLGPGPRELIWRGRDDADRRVPAGGYVAVLVVTDAGGGVRRRERVLVVVR